MTIHRSVPILLFTSLAVVMLALPDAAYARTSAEIFAELAQKAQQYSEAQVAIARQRESAARNKLEEQQQLLTQAIARRDAAKARGDALRQQLEDNDVLIIEYNELLEQQQGAMGEMFGVVRVVAAEAQEQLHGSLLNTQFEPNAAQKTRTEFLQQLAKAKSLPSIKKLERLWFELLREMIGQGKVVRYQTGVLQLDEGKPTETTVPTEVVRVGPFTVVNGNEFLGYLSSVGSLTELNGVMPGHLRDTAYGLTQTAAGAGYTRAVVDVTRGGLLGLFLQRPGWFERVQLGAVVGYLIIALGIIGVLLALFQFGYLLKTRLAVRTQLGDPTQPKNNNPLGRLLLTFRNGNNRPERAELAALRLHEAVQKEVPKLERFQSFLRLAIAAGPLLGLIGTVIGMIITFHAIIDSGGGDPTVMAKGIGQAMIATVLGLGIAIPLLFINTGLMAFSGNITQLLDEFSNTLLAEYMKSGKDDAAFKPPGRADNPPGR